MADGGCGKPHCRSMVATSAVCHPPSEISFPFLHHLKEFREQVIRVVWARRRFRVILNAECWNGTMLKAFNGVVVQVDMRHSDIVRIEAVGIYREAMILCRDLDLIPIDVKYGMVSAVMSKLQ